MLTAFHAADILLPKDVDMEKWAVIACDQFTAEPEYWAETKQITEGAVTALDLILPEVYLNEKDVDERIAKIHANMFGYLDTEVFEEYKDALIYIERVQTDGIVRAGIVGAIDLEQYDYTKGSTSQVRATEATVVERIPPRVKVRKSAPVELPHIMILIDDEKKQVIEPIAGMKDSLKKLYGFDLMQGGGRIDAWLLDSLAQEAVFGELDKLADRNAFNRRYGLTDAEPLVYAMGDGNHSLATAKAFYEQLKAENPDKDMSRHPARYALAEIVNLHSPALNFEAIHRIVTGVDEGKLIADITEALGLSEGKTDGKQSFAIVNNGETKWYTIANESSKLTVGTVQNFLDKWVKDNGAEIDYIHGTDVVERLAAADGAVGFVLPDMSKQELFPTVIADGALPRKTFSMGHARDKRYYVEARKITED
ncbi:Uncharacterized conserved protein, DUF1015 family [Ruminococcus sp. YE71]|uniref:DUF1015 domain-containing protein n=1 Tax=unclassified Ruminococcus TaxID=2608920 RepID=UPI0008855D65|nr:MULTISPECIES: DUF1015 domain-containing protein [unclassified Ruminococcus]SDA20271.1 Uncharacterized conserved protein, DUF1015 family [Ruminococcus sp. YE78]SFW32164.1 Uncharacterized conserved protein, DUF1015 family [Ruminococcus sp. YE71]